MTYVAGFRVVVTPSAVTIKLLNANELYSVRGGLGVFSNTELLIEEVCKIIREKRGEMPAPATTQEIADLPQAPVYDPNAATDVAPVVDKVFMGGERTKYHRAIGVVGCECGKRTRVWADVYDVLGAFTGHYTARIKPIVDHLLKKLLAGGERGHKDLRQDMVDVHDSAQRAIDTIDEWV